MSLSKLLWSLSVTAAGAASVVHAGNPPASVQPYNPAPVVSGPVLSSPTGPGCAAPTLPGMIVPGTPVMPGTATPLPGTPGSPGMTPSTPGVTPTDVGAAAGLAAASTVGTGGGEGGSGALQSGAPNMFGDAFSSRPLFVGLPGAVQFVGQQSFTLFPQGPFAFVGTPGNTQLDPIPATVDLGGVLVTLPAGVSLVNPAPAVTPVGSRLPVVESRELTDAVRQRVTPSGQIARFNPGSAAVVLVQGPGSFLASVNELYDIYAPTSYIRTSLPNPSSGVVGRPKISEDNNPVPRDRLIFNTDYYSAVPLVASGVAVHRNVVGFEKTFLDQQASVEVRVPFASTIDSTITADGVSGRATQLGNIGVILKTILYGSERLTATAGVGVGLPTGNDVRVRLNDGTDLVHISNDAFIVTPYAALLYTPSDRAFTQVWVAYGVDANGSGADVNTDLTGLRRVGRFTDQNLAQIDGQVGYWLYRAPDTSALLQGFAPFVELHYNATVGGADVIQAGLFQLGTGGSFNELNVTLGATTQIGTNFLLTAGLVLPLKSQVDRTFDYQLGIRGTLFFGPTARSRAAAANVSSF